MHEELEYIYGLERLGIKPGLAVMERMMDALGHPEKAFKSIHVTGTNGKGSTCAMLESVLREAGHVTAMYTSPHLYTFNERIRVMGVPISDDELVRLIHEIRSVIEDNAIEATFFEFTTALALLYFSRAHIDIAIIEVGMGGRYDATNVITPFVSVITNIGLDHTEYLGDTVEEIAREKAGIIKEDVPVVVSEQQEPLLEIFEQEAEKKHTQVIRAQDVVQTRLVSSSLDGQIVAVTTETISYNVMLPLLGEHQVHNLATAIATLMPIASLERTGMLTPKEIISGIAKTVWEGRLQVVSRDPLIIVDGAHNVDGARALYTFLQNINRLDVIIFAAKKGKDISYIRMHIIPLFSHVIVTKGSYMPEDPEVIAKEIRQDHAHVYIEPDAGAAIVHAKKLVPEHGTIVVAGSLYMIPDALAALKQTRV